MEKSVLITGSTKGIGFEIARQLGKKDYHVIISGRDQKKLLSAKNELIKESINVQDLLLDISSDEAVTISANIFSTWNIQLDILINNAAILLSDDHLISKDSSSIFRETMNTNVYGALRVVQHFSPFLISNGKIINISSGGGSMSEPVGGWAPSYCISKSSLNALTRQLAYEFSGKFSVNAVCPGWVKTDMGGLSAPRHVSKGAETPVWLASEVPSSVTGKFFRDKQEIDW